MWGKAEIFGRVYSNSPFFPSLTIQSAVTWYRSITYLVCVLSEGSMSSASSSAGSETAGVTFNLSGLTAAAVAAATSTASSIPTGYSSSSQQSFSTQVGAPIVSSSINVVPSSPGPHHPPASHTSSSGKDYGGLDFKIIWDSKSGPAITIHLVAPTMQEKAAWTSDISQVSYTRVRPMT